MRALDDLPAEFRKVLETDPVVVSNRGHEHRAYGQYIGGTVARDDYPDRIVIYQDTLERDFGHDPDLLRAQVERTVRHEVAHHLGWDEPGVRGLGPVDSGDALPAARRLRHRGLGDLARLVAHLRRGRRSATRRRPAPAPPSTPGSPSSTPRTSTGVGPAETVWGEVLSDFDRDSYVLATKLFLPMTETDSRPRRESRSTSSSTPRSSGFRPTTSTSTSATAPIPTRRSRRRWRR